MGGIFGGSQPALQPLPPPPSRSDADVQAAALATRRRAANASGRASTILTSGQGVRDEVDTRKTVLGGA